LAVPTISDIKKLVPYTSGTGTSVGLTTAGVWRCVSGPGGLARLHYDLAALPIPFGEEFEVGCEIRLDQQWGRGGTILRVESYAPAGSKLWRTELNIFGDGLPHVVRNCHTNGGGTHEYTDLGACSRRLPVGSACFLLMRGVLSTLDAAAWLEVVLNGDVIGRFEQRNVTASQGAPQPYVRARYCQVQGPDNAVATTLSQAWVKPLGTVSPPPPPVDPCASVQAALDAEIAAHKATAASLADANLRLVQIRDIAGG
jgi:hypothetical protein